MATIGTAISLMARKAAAFDFIVSRDLMVNKSSAQANGTHADMYWVANRSFVVWQRGLYPTAIDAVEAFMKNGEGE